jgi:hypothetical protein
VKLIDLANLADLFGVVPVMGKLVMTFVHAEIGVAAVTRFVGKDERGNSRRIRLKGQHQQIAHEPQVLANVG